MPKEFKFSREIIHDPSDPEILRTLEDREQKFITEHPPSPEVKMFLEGVDFERLKKIYMEIALRCGIPAEKFNFVDKTRVVGGFTGVSGKYLGEFNALYLRGLGERDDQGMPVAELQREAIEDYGDIQSFQLHTLIHEEGHAVSRNLSIIANGNNIPSRFSLDRVEKRYLAKIYYQSGFQSVYSEGFVFGSEKYDASNAESYIKDGKRAKKYAGFSALNEGVTEKLSREVMMRYLEESGVSQREIDLIKKTFTENKGKSLAYTKEVAIVDRIVEKLAAKSGVSPEVAWEAFVRGYFNGEGFEDEEVEQLFFETFGPDFLRELSRLLGGFLEFQDGYRDFCKKYGFKDLSIKNN